MSNLISKLPEHGILPNSVMFSSHEGCLSLLSPVSYFTIQDPLLCPQAFGIFPEYLQEFFPVRWKGITSKVSSFPVSGQAVIQLPLCSIQHIWIVIALSPFMQIHLPVHSGHSISFIDVSFPSYRISSTSYQVIIQPFSLVILYVHYTLGGDTSLR